MTNLEFKNNAIVNAKLLLRGGMRVTIADCEGQCIEFKSDTFKVCKIRL